MAQPGQTVIQLYASTTASAVPSSANLVSGELALNLTDKKVFTKDGSGSVVEMTPSTTNALAVTAGGTGATSASAARTNLGAGDVVGPASSTDNTLPRFNGTTGKLLQGSGVVVDDSGNLETTGQIYAAGGRGVTTGFVLPDWRMYNGSSGNTLVFNNGTDRMTLDSSGNLGVGRTPNYKVDAYLPGSGSPAVASANDSMVTVMQSVGTSQATIGTLTSHPLVFITANTERARIDTSGNLTLNAGAFGYGAGAGGTGTQPTSKTTGVAVNKPNGLITMNGASLGPGIQVEFVFTNSFIGTNDSVVVHPQDATNGFAYDAQCYFTGTGVAYIRVKNISSASRSDELILKFSVIKGSIT